MDDKAMSPKDQINIAVELLETILKKNGLPGYDQIISDDQKEAALKDVVVKIEVMSLVNLIFVLKNASAELDRVSDDAALHHQIRDIFKDDLEKEIVIREMIKSASKKDKEFRKREALITKGWSEGKRTPDYDLFEEYLELIEAFPPLLREINKWTKGENKKFEKKEAITFLTEKYQIKSWDATFQRIDTARVRKKSKLKAQGKDSSYLDGILPGNWPIAVKKPKNFDVKTAENLDEETAEDFDEEPERNINCRLYEQCYNRAAYANKSLDCRQCKDYTPACL